MSQSNQYPRKWVCGARRASSGKRIRVKLFGVWCSMRTRCMNPNSQKWHRYGARGIKICQEWGDYRVFREWAISTGYRKGLTIDRIDNDGNYEPDNCRWLTKSANSSKLTPADVRAIRQSSKGHYELAVEYGVHPTWITRLQRYERRTDVT